MNTSHNNGDNDRSLIENLDTIGHSYARLDKEEPPELLDMAVLNSAHRAVEKKTLRMRFGWLHGLTTAAVFVLALSLISKQQESRPLDMNGMGREAQPQAPLDMTEKKQSPMLQSDELNRVLKDKGALRSDMSQGAPAPAAEAPAEDTVFADTAEAEKASSDDVQSPRAKALYRDEDGQADAVKTEKAVTPETDTIRQSPQAATANEMRRPVKSSEPDVLEKETSGKTDSDASQQIQAIIQMKQRGDENWKTELKAFVDSHPDYPLPEELKN